MCYILAKELTTRIQNRVFDYKTNLPGNICYSIITPNKAAWVRHEYSFSTKIERTSNTSNLSKESFDSAKEWYKGFTNDLFGLN